MELGAGMIFPDPIRLASLQPKARAVETGGTGDVVRTSARQVHSIVKCPPYNAGSRNNSSIAFRA